MRILVTGGAGFIGSHYVRSLLGSDLPARAVERLTVLDKLTYAGRKSNIAAHLADPRLTFVHGDIGDPELVDEVMAGQDVVVHFAAESHVDRSIAEASVFVRTNVLGTEVLLSAARRHDVGTFVHVSTDEVYGSLERGSWPETDPMNPNSPYAASKASSDLLALAYHRTFGMDVRITRCSNNYGPYQFPEKVIPLFVTNLLEGKKVPLYGDGMNVRDWLHVDDHCHGIRLVVEKGQPGEIYNIGGGQELANIELAHLLLDALGQGREMIEHVEDRKGHDRRYSVDWSKARAEIGYEPRHDFSSGLADTIDWYRENQDWWTALKKR
ncbi:dTDP-glucose 4,6-dehydratase [Streptomyces sp. NPDC019890]|uniref:dTDP-glucose 4,6-dehydratase n=1 Tax=Streptomyces sp. NPDC019890 TaxID=3365064 RepID=UPI00384C47AE